MRAWGEKADVATPGEDTRERSRSPPKRRASGESTDGGWNGRWQKENRGYASSYGASSWRGSWPSWEDRKGRGKGKSRGGKNSWSDGDKEMPTAEAMDAELAAYFSGEVKPASTTGTSTGSSWGGRAKGDGKGSSEAALDEELAAYMGREGDTKPGVDAKSNGDASPLGTGGDTASAATEVATAEKEASKEATTEKNGTTPVAETTETDMVETKKEE